MFSAAIFDLDGLLVDSAPLWARAEREVFGSLGVDVTARDQRATARLSTAAVTRFWFTRRPWDGPSLSDVEARVIDRVRGLAARGVTIMPGVTQVLSLCRTLRLTTGIATNAPARVCDVMLAQLDPGAGFDVVVTADDVARPKPQPDVYALAARRLGAEPQHCLVFEDSPEGVAAARRAGMTVVAVVAQPGTYVRGPLPAHTVVAALDTVDEAMLASLAAKRSTRPIKRVTA